MIADCVNNIAAKKKKKRERERLFEGEALGTGFCGVYLAQVL